MGNYLIKPQLDVDLYVWWSSNSDSPILWGTKAEFKRLYKKRKWMFRFGEDFKEQIKWADRGGVGRRFGYAPEYLAYGGYGTIAWDNIPALLQIWGTDTSMEQDDPRLMWLVDKHEWDD